MILNNIFKIFNQLTRTRWWVERDVLIFSCENSKITTHYWTTIDRRMLDPTEKKIPHIQGQRRSPSKMVGGAKLHLDSNPIPARDVPRDQTKPCAHQETPQRLSQTAFECLLQRYGSAVACHRGRGSGCSRPGCGISPLGGCRHQPQHRAARTYIRLGNKTQFPPQSVSPIRKLP